MTASKQRPSERNTILSEQFLRTRQG